MGDEAYESENRRAEIHGARLTFYRVTGNVRRTKHAWWFYDDLDTNVLRKAAKEYAFKGKVIDKVLH